MKSIFVIGIGINGRESLLQGPLSKINSAGLLVGGRRHLDEFREAEGEKFPLKGLDEAASRIKVFLQKKKGHVAVLATGDPLLYGIGTFILKEFGEEKVEIIPNVSTIQEAFARIKEDMNGVKVLSAHGRATDFDMLANEVMSNRRIALFTDKENNPALLSRELLRRGLAGCRAYVCEALGMKAEKVTSGTLDEIAKKRTFDPLNVFIIVNEKSGRIDTGFGVPDSSFSHSSGMITKEELRVIILSKLRITPASAVWDIGACSGSVAIEAARLTRGQVFAIEKEPGRVRDIKENVERFGARNVSVIEGEAPGALKGLPAPDAVFVGGGGAGIGRILSAVSDRLKRGGRVVVSAVTIETASKAFEFLTGKEWEKELLLVSISKSKAVANLTMLSANNPLFIISGRKPQ